MQKDHKPFEWLAIISNVHGRRGRWIDMLQDFSSKIVHRPRLKHTNADALSRNLVGPATDDDNFSEKIQDIRNIQTDTHGEEGEILSVWTGK